MFQDFYYLFEAPPVPYGLITFFIFFLLVGFKEKFIALIISLVLGLQSITDFALIRPDCLSPILIENFLNEGISKRPLEEFPIIKSEYLRHEKYFFWPSDLNI